MFEKKIAPTVGKYQHYLHESGLLGSEKQWLWEFTCYRSEMLKHSSEKFNFHFEKEAKWTSKPQKIQSFPATIPHFPAEMTFWSKFFHNTDVVRDFSEQNFPWKSKPQNLVFRGLDVYITYFSVWNFKCQVWELIRQAKRS
jgi:hypothetical protein